MIQDQVLSKLKATYARNTVYCTATYVHRILRWLEDHGAPRLEKPKVAHNRPRQTMPTVEELVALDIAATPWQRLWLRLCVYNGLRNREARELTAAQWNRQAHTIAIARKGSKVTTMHVLPEVEELMQQAPNPADVTTPLVAKLAGRNAVAITTMRNAWLKLLKAAGCRTNLNPHDLRRSAAVRLYTATKDLVAVQKMLGHDNMLSTLTYLEPHDPGAMQPLLAALRLPYPKEPTRDLN
jgi:integrase